MNLQEKINDWKKLKLECEKAQTETDKNIKRTYLENFWFGVKAYKDKYKEKFDFWNEPKD